MNANKTPITLYLTPNTSIFEEMRSVGDTLSNAIYALFLINKRALSIKTNPQAKETYLSIPNDKSNTYPTSTGDYFTNPTQIPPELSIFLIGLADLNINITKEGLVVIDPDTGTSFLFATYKNGQNKDVFIDNKKELVILGRDLVISQELRDEFSNLTYLLDTLRPTMLIGGRASNLNNQLCIKDSYVLADFEEDDFIDEAIRKLTLILARHTMLELDSSSVREERKYIYHINRALKICTKFNLIGKDYGVSIIRKVQGCIVRGC